ncbi:zinc ribbon domain-containing protein [uncultured Prevotella sp.]|uniref:double zinc ribbon domain-containing protein n=1 Tax=uncultured Prevotella sp. TaxID=159272 RepID=UPI0027E38E78|nr:zinc-ribbon domain-containing protein [uncultured Prevotella sp.]
MAIIKCPECGHEISDKAPFCPSCGVAIAGKVVECPKCGKVYFSELSECPQCHYKRPVADKTPIVENNNAVNIQETEKTTEVENVEPKEAEKQVSLAADNKESKGVKNNERSASAYNEQPVGANNPEEANDENLKTPRNSSRNNKIIIGAVVAIVAVVIGIGCYFYYSIQSDKELQAYNYAMASNDPQVLQSYLDQYSDAPEAHLDSIQSHLDLIKKTQQDWTNVMISNSKSALEDYIAQHPDSPYKAIAIHKIDSIDWQTAQQQNTVEALELYIEQHSDGEHVEDANQMINSLNSKTIQPEERLMVNSIYGGFLKSLGDKDEEALTSFVNPLLTNFLGKTNATRSDVVTFMHKIYKSDVKSMAWKSLGDYTINKKNVGANQYEYSVAFSAIQTIVCQDDNATEVRYKITSTLNNEGRISDFNMIRLAE